MSKLTIVSAALAAVLVAAPAWASSCPRHMGEIDAKLATNPQVAQQTLDQAKQLRAQGEELHKAGKHAESMEALAAAKKLLGM